MYNVQRHFDINYFEVLLVGIHGYARSFEAKKHRVFFTSLDLSMGKWITVTIPTSV